MQNRSRHPGFTLVEIIIASAVIAILAAIILPRLNRASSQTHESTVERIAALMSSFATRESTGTQQVAMLQDPDSGEIGLSVMMRTLGEGGDAAGTEWVPDPLTQPFRLPRGVEITDVIVDDESIGSVDWMVASIPGGGRPKVEIRVAGEGLDTVLMLDSGAIAPVRIDSGKDAPPVREPVDLDSTGRGREPW